MGTRAAVLQRERCDCNTDCLKKTGHLNEQKHECQVKRVGRSCPVDPGTGWCRECMEIARFLCMREA